MAQGARQNSLFAAEDFSVVYESFSQANFQAYDFETIRNAMVDYINNNYPENFNDWISSSEFVSLIELMAFLGHNLAFRADLASRENYLSTAERRESALRIAEFLGYTPTRNIIASGYLKIDSVRTSEKLFDVNGQSLANANVQFDDVNDPDTYQNFLTIMNSIFQSSSQFGSPFAKFKSNNIQNEIYRTNSTNSEVVFNFSNSVNGTRAPFTTHSVYYNQNLGRLEEKEPNPNGVIDILYKNDNSGITSPNTGFFVGFKQGNLEYRDFIIDSPLPNLVLDINEANVANGNIWVQTVDESGRILKRWTRVDRLFGLNAVFNNVNNNVRDIFTVSSRENDQVSIIFADGNFGNIPRGIIRVWYRTGLNQNYTLTPNSFGSINYNIQYVGRDGNTHRASFVCSLKSNVSNASQRESIDSIKANAGRFFATQDRMITSDDYSLYPLTASENIRKIKSINRVHSGHSRFRDFHDPTATYSDASMYTDDLYIYRRDLTTRNLVSLPTSMNSEQIYQRYIRPILNNPEVKNFYYDRHFYGPIGLHDPNKEFSNTMSGLKYYNLDGSETDVYRWNQVTKGNNSSSGYITLNSIIQRLGDSATQPMRKLESNAMAEFITSPYKEGYIRTILVVDGGSGYTSPPSITITGSGTDADAFANISNGKVVSITILNSGTGYTTATNVNIIGGGGTGARARAEVVSPKTYWARITNVYSDGLGEDDATGTPTGLDPAGRGAVVLNQVIPSGARIKRIVPSWEFELTELVKASVISKIENRNSFGLKYDPVTQEWKVIESSNLPSNTVALNSADNWSRLYENDDTDTGRNNSWIIRVNYNTNDWEILTRKSRYVIGSDRKLKFNNLNFQETFSSDTLKPTRDNIEILPINTKSKSDNIPLGQTYKFNVVGYFVYSDGFTDPNKIRVALADPDNDGFPNNPAAFKDIVTSETIKLGTSVINNYEYTVLDPAGSQTQPGRDSLHARYNRIADMNQVIDPATTNIIDTYVLLRSYETQFTTWAKFDGRPYTKPNPPTINELTNMFERLDSKKSISDQVIYRPVKFKILFGDLASSELQARFHVTKTTNATMSDTEIKQEVIKLIERFFNIDNWDFGETFYFTELAAFIHNNMIGQVAQINVAPVDNQQGLQSLFEIRNDSDEMFVPVISTSNIIVNDNILLNPTTIAANTGVSLP